PAAPEAVAEDNRRGRKPGFGLLVGRGVESHGGREDARTMPPQTGYCCGGKCFTARFFASRPRLITSPVVTGASMGCEFCKRAWWRVSAEKGPPRWRGIPAGGPPAAESG